MIDKYTYVIELLKKERNKIVGYEPQEKYKCLIKELTSAIKILIVQGEPTEEQIKTLKEKIQEFPNVN